MTTAAPIPRDLLGKYFGDDPRLLRAFEDQSMAVAETAETLESTVSATGALQDATVLTLSANDVFTNERILSVGDGLDLDDDGMHVTVSLDGVARTADGYSVTFVPPGDCTLFLPLSGTLATRAGVETLSNKTLAAPKLSGLTNAADDAAAAGAGVPVGGVYRDGSSLKVRVT